MHDFNLSIFNLLKPSVGPSSSHTAGPMQAKYKETSQGGLAVNVVKC